MSAKIAIYGTGGFAREVAWLVSQIGETDGSTAVAFVDDDPEKHGVLDGLPVMGLAELATQFAEASVAIGVGAPAVRARLAERVLSAGLQEARLVHPRVEMSKSVTVGSGSIICGGSILTVGVTIARQVHVNLDCTVGHDVTIADFCTLSPGVHISGWVKLGQGVFVGTGATVINGTPQRPLVIGDGAIVGAGACVVRDVAAGETVVGGPARPRGEVRGNLVSSPVATSGT